MEAIHDRVIARHSVTSFIDLNCAAQWAALTGSELLDRMAGNCDVLVTVDRGMSHQQRQKGRSFGIVVLRARTNRLGGLAPLASALMEAFDRIGPGEVVEVAEPLGPNA